MEDKIDKFIKLSIVGDRNVGKSKLLIRYNDDVYSEISYQCVDFITKTYIINNKNIRVQTWNTTKREQQYLHYKCNFTDSEGIILCYSITDSESFHNLIKWKENIKIYAQKKVKVILCGTKNDDIMNRQVTLKEGKDFADANGYEFIEISSKTGINIELLFTKLINRILNEK